MPAASRCSRAASSSMSNGGKVVTGVELADHTHIACDAVAMSGGWSPIVNLACHKGAKPIWNDELAPSCRPMSAPAFTAAGSAAWRDAAVGMPCRRRREGGRGVERPRLQAEAAAPPKCRDEAYRVTPLWWVKECNGKAFVDYQNDVTAKDLPLAAREGYSDDRARQALHDGRHGDRPGQARQCQCHRHPRRSDGQDASPRSAPRPSGPSTRRSPSAPSPGPSPAIISSRCARRRCMTGRKSRARSSSRPGCGMRSSLVPAAA